MYRFQPGSSDVVYEVYGLDIFLAKDSESYARQIEEVLLALVGIMTYLVRGELQAEAVTSAKRKRDVEEDHVSAKNPKHQIAAQVPGVPEAPCHVSSCSPCAMQALD